MERVQLFGAVAIAPHTRGSLRHKFMELTHNTGPELHAAIYCANKQEGMTGTVVRATGAPMAILNELPAGFDYYIGAADHQKMPYIGSGAQMVSITLEQVDYFAPANEAQLPAVLRAARITAAFFVNTAAHALYLWTHGTPLWHDNYSRAGMALFGTEPPTDRAVALSSGLFKLTWHKGAVEPVYQI